MKPLSALLLLALVAGDAAACRYPYPSVNSAPALYRRAPDGSEQGLMPELAARVQQRSGCQLFARDLPLARRNIELRQGKLAMILLVVHSPAMEPFAEFVPLLRLPLRATVPIDSPLQTADALLAGRNSRIGLLRGALFSAEVEQRLMPLQATGRVEYSNDRDSLYQKLRRGRLDGVLETTSWLNQPRDEHGLRYLPFVPPLYLTAGTYLSYQLPADDRAALRSAVQYMARSGEFQLLLDKHLPQLASQARRP